jgi:adenosylcobinamide amidohydrolase
MNDSSLFPAKTTPKSHAWYNLHLNSLLDIQVYPEYCTVRFSRPLDVLSSAILNGGKSRAMGWLNLRVTADAPADKPLPAPEHTLREMAQHIGMSGPTVGMMTAASMKSCRVRYVRREDVFVCCVATTGIANARRAGDTADSDDWASCQRHTPQPAGTINIAVFTNANLTDTAKVEALQLIAEAKTAACHDGDVISPVSQLAATGTGTDALAIFSDPEGLPIDYCGKHVIMGEIIGSLVYDVVQEGIDACRTATA